ncbi:ankyrin repeat protein (macronuclear) [Tetrahymena thermophila SB210]|uniref:Ankyrin repeat protein n=1 Tax=Tetrahymena thermophila (strain SB210) TaxID=312017 RepID=I7LUK5_TETTS|nr:ankyrin repeat protein [Tetrahymena thermophila SB210]EAR94167.2 ankyrin repeat protein [Tetrahymena thermophila SB210]|eukprot:XP_001014412.2 ankyrin repeat protein [Tetrahymena thermophila SB210]
MIKSSSQVQKILEKIQKKYPDVTRKQNHENNLTSFDTSSQNVGLSQTINQALSSKPSTSQGRIQTIKGQSFSNKNISLIAQKQHNFSRINKSSNSSPQRKTKGQQSTNTFNNTQNNFSNNQTLNGLSLLNNQHKPSLEYNNYIENLEKKLNELNGNKNSEKKNINLLYKPQDTLKKRTSQKKLKMCRQFVITGLCRYGQTCQFAHNIQELDIQYIPKVWSKHFDQHKKSNQYLSELKYNFPDKQYLRDNYSDQEEKYDEDKDFDDQENQMSYPEINNDNTDQKQSEGSYLGRKSATNLQHLQQSSIIEKQQKDYSSIIKKYNQTSLSFNKKPQSASQTMLTKRMSNIDDYIVDINKIINQRGRSLLLEAVLLGQLDVVKELLLKGANPSITDWSGNDCILYSIKKNSTDILRYLLDYSQFELDLNKRFGTSETTYLIYAAQNSLKNIVIILLAQGADPNIQDQQKRTALTFAVKNNDKDTIQALCENGAVGTIVDDFNKTPVDYAFTKKQLDIVTYLFKKGGVFADQKKNRKVMFFAAENNLIDLIHEMIQRNNPISDKDHLGNSILMLLYKNRHFDNILKMIEELNLTNQICEKNNNGDCVLTLMSKEGNEYLAIQLIQRYSGQININIQDKEGKTCLIYACEHGLDSLVELLLQKGADCNIYDRNWDTPLLLASKNNHLMCVRYILQYAKGIDILWKDQYQNTARNCSQSVAIKSLISQYMIEQDKMSDSLIKELEDEEFNLKQYFDQQANNTSTSQITQKKSSIIDYSQQKKLFRISKKYGK